MTKHSLRPSRVALPFAFILTAFSVGCGDSAPSGSLDAGAACIEQADCDDGVFCNGAEQCVPGRR